MDRRLTLIEGVLDLEPSAYLRCGEEPNGCSDGCVEDPCPLQTNRLHELGSLVLSMLEEFRWCREWAHEMETVGIVPKGTVKRVGLRVRRAQLVERMEDTQKALDEVEAGGPLHEVIAKRLEEMQSELDNLHEQIGDAGK
jgi:hypothetical protein